MQWSSTSNPLERESTAATSGAAVALAATPSAERCWPGGREKLGEGGVARGGDWTAGVAAVEGGRK